MMSFVRARWYHVGRRGVQPRLIVVHCTVSPDSSKGAEGVAAYFARGERKASAHRTSDSNSTVISVIDADTAFAAAGANQDGLHLELVGRPEQTTAQWLDDFGDAMLKEAGKTIREWSGEFKIPLRWLTVAQVADGHTRGLCTHYDVSRAFPKVSTGHWDPGGGFPKAHALKVWTAQQVRPTIRRGASGPHVAYLQTVLRDAGYRWHGIPIRISNPARYGAMTESIVKSIKRYVFHETHPDSAVGPKMWRLIEEIRRKS